MTDTAIDAVFPVPAYRGGERRNSGTRNVPGNEQDRLHESSGNVPGTPENAPVPRSRTLYRGTEERGTPNRPRKPYRVQARPAEWGNADGTTSDIVKLYGGARAPIAVDYSEIPRLIAELAELLHEHQRPSRKEEA